MRLHWLALTLSLAPITVHASMRCNSALIDEGDLAVEVLRKCGQPAERQITPPALKQNGLPRHGAVAVEHWVYGPQNGTYRTLRFIDGRLVEIRNAR